MLSRLRDRYAEWWERRDNRRHPKVDGVRYVPSGRGVFEWAAWPGADPDEHQHSREYVAPVVPVGAPPDWDRAHPGVVVHTHPDGRFAHSHREVPTDG